jgi:hypothetical protein
MNGSFDRLLLRLNMELLENEKNAWWDLRV